MGVDMKKMRNKGKSVDWTEFCEYNGDGDLVGLQHEGRLVHETDRAILVVCKGEEIWVPKSQIGDADDEALMITKWWAEKEGLDTW